jgi:uncharacterized protein YhfF
VRIHPRSLTFGYSRGAVGNPPAEGFPARGDGGLGLRLIAQIRAGAKTATVAPMDVLTPGEIAETRDSAGHVVTVRDKDGAPHCNVRILDVIEIRWGAPDPRVVRGEGFTDDDAWRTAMANAWSNLVAGGRLTLRDDSVLLAELFELVGDDD